MILMFCSLTESTPNFKCVKSAEVISLLSPVRGHLVSVSSYIYRSPPRFWPLNYHYTPVRDTHKPICTSQTSINLRAEFRSETLKKKKKMYHLNLISFSVTKLKDHFLFSH